MTCAYSSCRLWQSSRTVQWRVPCLWSSPKRRHVASRKQTDWSKNKWPANLQTVNAALCSVVSIRDKKVTSFSVSLCTSKCLYFHHLYITPRQQCLLPTDRIIIISFTYRLSFGNVRTNSACLIASTDALILGISSIIYIIHVLLIL